MCLVLVPLCRIARVRADASEATLRCLTWRVALLEAASAVHVRSAPVKT